MRALGHYPLGITVGHGRYILRGTEAVPCEDLLEWGRWYETADRVVDETFVQHPVSGVVIRISTVFLGLDLAFRPAEPLLFETMAFAEPEEMELFGDLKLMPKALSYQRRYSTWAEAVEGHQQVHQDIVLSIEVERAQTTHAQE